MTGSQKLIQIAGRSGVTRVVRRRVRWPVVLGVLLVIHALLLVLFAAVVSGAGAW